jgi:uncharacterized membrane protein YadS
MPGLLLSATIALAVRFVSDRLGGPAMLYALLFGMAFNFLTEDERFARGIRFASRNILRFGVALLGLRITTGEVMDLGWPVVALIVASVVATILIGGLIGRATAASPFSRPVRSRSAGRPRRSRFRRYCRPIKITSATRS